MGQVAILNIRYLVVVSVKRNDAPVGKTDLQYDVQYLVAALPKDPNRLASFLLVDNNNYVEMKFYNDPTVTP